MIKTIIKHYFTGFLFFSISCIFIFILLTVSLIISLKFCNSVSVLSRKIGHLQNKINIFIFIQCEIYERIVKKKFTLQYILHFQLLIECIRYFLILAVLVLILLVLLLNYLNDPPDNFAQSE